jgi:hypothetical protein
MDQALFTVGTWLHYLDMLSQNSKMWSSVNPQFCKVSLYNGYIGVLFIVCVVKWLVLYPSEKL